MTGPEPVSSPAPAIGPDMTAQADRQKTGAVLAHDFVLSWLEGLKIDILNRAEKAQGVVRGKNTELEAVAWLQEKITAAQSIRSAFTHPQAVLSQIIAQAKTLYGELTTELHRKIAYEVQSLVKLAEEFPSAQVVSEEKDQLFAKCVNESKVAARVILAIEATLGRIPADLLNAQNPFDSRGILESESQVEPAEAPVTAYDELVSRRLAVSRKDLLDVGLRNPLLNFAPSTRSLEIVNEHGAEVCRLLVKEKQSMVFDPSSEQVATQPELKLPEADPKDLRLQTSHQEIELQKRHLNLERQARIDLDDKGINTLFLTVGSIYWKDKTEGKERRAPLTLIPVKLDRGNVRERFKISHQSDEIEENMPLKARILQDYGVALPDMSDLENFDFTSYIEQVRSALSVIPGIRIEPNELNVALISHSRYLLYRDIDPEIWPSHKKPWQHPIVSALLGGGFAQKPSIVPAGSTIDHVHDLDTNYTVLPADGSQLKTLVEGLSGRNLSVEGPPGTGKSQTIVNLIAGLVAQGKKVLFVSEKKAALEVVESKIKEIGLGDLLLAIHSDRTRKKDVLDDLRRTLELGKPRVSDRSKIIESLQEQQAKLVNHTEALNKVNAVTNLSYAEAAVEFLALSKQGLFAFDPSELRGVSRQDFDRAVQISRGLMTQQKVTGPIAKHPYYGVKRTTKTAFDEVKLKELLSRVSTNQQEYSEIIKKIGEKIGVNIVSEQDGLLLGQALKLIKENWSAFWSAEYSEQVFANRTAWTQVSVEQLKSAFALLEKQRALLKEAGNLGDLTDAYYKDIKRIKSDLERYDGRPFARILSGRYRELRQEALDYFKFGAKLSFSEMINGLEQAFDFAVCQEEFNATSAGGVIRSDLSSCSDDTFNRTKNALMFFRELLELTVGPEKNSNQTEATWAEKLLRNFEYTMREPVTEAVKAYQKWQQSWQALADFAGYDSAALADFLGSKSINHLGDKLDGYIKNTHRFQEIVTYNQLVQDARDAGIGFVIQTLEKRLDVADRLDDSLRLCWLAGILADASETDELGSFHRATIEDTVQEYRRLCFELQSANISSIAQMHWEQLPKVVTGGQTGVLRMEMSKKTAHKPLRKLFEEAGGAIQRVKPVMMMSPLTVARFLSPESSVEFDVVIIDEGSQLKAAQVLGPALRANQLIVMGDTRQLPPTSYFEGGVEIEECEASRTADLESVLDLMRSQNASATRLTTHYRSRHPSLIEVSNCLHYNGDLRTFPTPLVDSRKYGLKFEKVEGATYTRGAGSVNLVEAQKVAEVVVHHLKNKSEFSLGVVALNSQQAELIYLEVEKRLRKDPKLLPRFSVKHEHAPFFVKSLENVQGDERDVMLVSIGYGPSADPDTGVEKMSMNFGPLNLPGGERRLNVLLTRAKHECVIFSSFDPEDLRPEGRAESILHLQAYLFYARDRELPLAISTKLERGNVKLNTLQKYLAQALKELGYEAVAMDPRTSAGIELAVVDPRDPTKFVLGICSDGAEYAAISSIQDREITIPSVLRSQGWNVMRVWLLDLLSSPDQVLKMIVENATVNCRDSKQQPASKVNLRLTRDNLSSAALRHGEFYQEARDFLGQYAQYDLETIGYRAFADIITAVVEVESPVHPDEVNLRIRQAAEIDRKTDNFEQVFSDGLQAALRSRAIEQRDGFLYSSSNEQIRIRDRSKFGSSRKKIELVAPEEISAAVAFVVTHACGIKAEELTAASLAQLGLRTVPDNAHGIVGLYLSELIQNGSVVKKGEYLYPSEELIKQELRSKEVE